MPGINTGILTKAYPLTEEQIKQLEKRVLENNEAFAYLNEDNELCFAIPQGVDQIKELAWHKTSELYTDEDNTFIKKVYRRYTPNSYTLDTVLQKQSINDSWGQPALAAGLYDANDELVASWDELINTYGMNAEMDYDSGSYSYSASSPYVVLRKSALSSGVKLVVGAGLARFGKYAFRESSLTSIVIPDSVTEIGSYAFFGWTNLTDITFGANSQLVSIGAVAFRNCTGLTGIVIPDSVTSIGDSAFDGCTGLTSVSIGNGVTSIDKSAFRGCKGLTSITIPDSVTSIGKSAFSECTGLTRISIGNSVTTIGESAFMECTNLNAITFGGTVEQWNTVEKGEYWNAYMPATEAVCSDGTAIIDRKQLG